MGVIHPKKLAGSVWAGFLGDKWVLFTQRTPLEIDGFWMFRSLVVERNTESSSIRYGYGNTRNDQHCSRQYDLKIVIYRVPVVVRYKARPIMTTTAHRFPVQTHTAPISIISESVRSALNCCKVASAWVTLYFCDVSAQVEYSLQL
jgi:hypothetical protein